MLHSVISICYRKSLATLQNVLDKKLKIRAKLKIPLYGLKDEMIISPRVSRDVK